MKMLMLSAAIVAGCVGGGSSPEQANAASVEGVRYLCVGMEYSARFGDCPGCEVDAKRLSSLLSDKYGYAGDLLISEKAKKSEVVAKLKAGIESTPENGLFLFLYSGHGGQEYIGGQEPDGADGADEYLCLYDTYMLDDEIWSIVSKCRGRVFLYFDACHSATMYRSVRSELKIKAEEKGKAKALGMYPMKSEDMIQSKGFTFRPENFVTATASTLDGDSPRSAVRLLCWSGCKEAEYSYGGSTGGTLTTAVVYNWKKGKTYEALWEAARSWVVRMQPGQNPVQTYVGSGFPSNTEAFK